MSADISTRYIYPGALHGQIADETPDQSLVFAARELAGIGLDSPLAAAGGDAAWVNALRKIEKAMLVRGWAWDQPK